MGSVSYRVDPECTSDVVMCSVDTTILLKEVDKEKECSSALKPLPANLRSLQCPLPGLETCFYTLVTSILFHRLYAKEMEQYDLRLFRGILVCGEHGVGKSAVVGAWGVCEVDRRGAACVSTVHKHVRAASECWQCAWQYAWQYAWQHV